LRGRSLLKFAVILPAVVHLAAIAFTVIRYGGFPFGGTDLVVMAALVTYLCVAGSLLDSRERSLNATVVIYSSLIAFMFLNVVAAVRLPPHTKGVWPRFKRVSTAAAGVMPGIEGEIVFSVNSLGLRGPEVSLDDSDLRVLCVGGSTTECLYVTDRDSWPWRLQSSLEAALGQRVFVGNAGKSGHFTLHHRYLLQHYAYAPRFEWVVVLAGMNDLGTWLGQNYADRAAKVQDETLYRFDERLPYYRLLPTMRLILEARTQRLRGNQVLQDPQGRYYVAQRAARRDVLRRGALQLPPDLAGALAAYRDNLHTIVELCRARGQQVVLMTQPTLWKEDLSSDLESLLWAATERGAYNTADLAKSMDAYNAALLGVCRDEGIECIDLASELPKDTTVFYDDCHFNVSGCRKVAAIVAARLTKRVRLGHSSLGAKQPQVTPLH
jgi:lysophospholipase L1-like esterase